MGGMVGFSLNKVTPVLFLVRAICELSCAFVLCSATSVFQTIRFSLILAVLRGDNGLMWLAAKGAHCMPASRTRCSRILRNSALSCE